VSLLNSPTPFYRILEVWFQKRRAKWRKKENTKKGPGRPAHNAHPQTCSGEPIPPEEVERRERDRREKKLRKQLERQAKRLQQVSEPGPPRADVNLTNVRETIQESLTELWNTNPTKETRALIGLDTFRLSEALGFDVIEVLPRARFEPRRQQILRSELYRQVRLYRQVLTTSLRRTSDPVGSNNRTQAFSRLVDQRTEWLWQLHLKQLRGRLPEKKPMQRNTVHGASQLNLPGFVHDALSLGPKFAVEKKRPPEEMLSMVRQLARLVPDEEASRVVSE
ncbi:hypothetical protein MTO96_038670, partial [Rhipicephalus appendiculatus]